MLLTLSLAAGAAEVVWLAAPSEADRVLVAERAGASGPALDPVDLRAATTRFGSADEQALRDLDRALEQARTYETQLDGELLILRDLEAAIGRIEVLRDDADRARLLTALLYQGFAAHRLGDAPEAEPYRTVVDGEAVVRPWLDAIALDPTRDATPYEIAEAPQRVAYNEARARLAGVLPATLTPKGLPPGARLVVDGRTTELGPAGNVKVGPGRHLAHVELDGRVIARFDVRVASGDDVPLALPVSESAWTTFLGALAPGAAVPAEIGQGARALGGEVWLARPGDEGPVVLALTPDGLRAVELEVPRDDGRDGGLDVELAVGALAGWLSSGDFYTQDPLVAPRTRATVNSAALGGFASVDLAVGPARIGAGLDLLVTPGDHHVALTGDGGTRVRPVPHLAAGLRFAQVTAGYLLPYHPALGARAWVPAGPVELRVSGWYGLAADRVRADGTTWDALPVYVLAAGGGVRF